MTLALKEFELSLLRQSDDQQVNTTIKVKEEARDRRQNDIGIGVNHLFWVRGTRHAFSMGIKNHTLRG